MATMQQELKRATKAVERQKGASEEDDAIPGAPRFSAKGLASQRKRLGLSADALGKLIGVSGLSVYNWESSKARPRAQHMAAIAALKTVGRRKAAAVLATR
jgi:DNA-binding transcriptional regulator YiaG